MSFLFKVLMCFIALVFSSTLHSENAQTINSPTVPILIDVDDIDVDDIDVDDIGDDQNTEASFCLDCKTPISNNLGSFNSVLILANKLFSGKKLSDVVKINISFDTSRCSKYQKNQNKEPKSFRNNFEYTNDLDVSNFFSNKNKKNMIFVNLCTSW